MADVELTEWIYQIEHDNSISSFYSHKPKIIKTLRELAGIKVKSKEDKKNGKVKKD